MISDVLNLTSGKWLVVNCGRFPSEKNCKLVFMAPESQKDDLLNAATSHAVKFHGHAESSELRKKIEESFEIVNI